MKIKQLTLDQLATQMFASLRYIAEHHPPSSLDEQPAQTPADGGQPAIKVETPQANGITQVNGDAGVEQEPRPDSPETFEAALQELSRDLVLKEQQIEVLIRALPGRSRGVQEQEEHMARLNKKLREMDEHLERAAEEKDVLLKRVEDFIWKVNRY